MPLAIERQSLAVISCTAPEAEIAQALQQHDSLVLMKVYGRFARIKALLAQAGLLECALMSPRPHCPASSAGAISTRSTMIKRCPIFRPFWSINSGSMQNET
ncbi:cobalt-precorrin-2 C(20)-methyltransferase [Salmonella enterica subsp. enterica]|nr:cobalt-precorrin-2 C(20)-methyltransferase [Salmonella enterica subsp. enterica]